MKESETVDSRQHCFLLQTSGHDPRYVSIKYFYDNVSITLQFFSFMFSLFFSYRYLSVETRQELLRIESSWNTLVVQSVIKLGVSRKFMSCTCEKMNENLIQLLKFLFVDFCSAKHLRFLIKGARVV